jgi:hypothetical protein
LIGGCSEEDPVLITDNSTEITFQIEQMNSENDFITTTKGFVPKLKSSGWRLNSDGKTQLTREIVFDVELQNGESVEFGFWFIKYETNAINLILEDEDFIYWERNWDYAATETERTNFFQEFDEARVLINSNGIFHNGANYSFIVESVKPTIINGEEKSYITIKFHGDAYGWYDPTGEYQEVYKLTNGVFKGVIE